MSPPKSTSSGEALLVRLFLGLGLGVTALLAGLKGCGELFVINDLDQKHTKAAHAQGEQDLKIAKTEGVLTLIAGAGAIVSLTGFKRRKKANGTPTPGGRIT